MAVDYTSTLQVLLDLQAISETMSGDRAFRSPDKFTRRRDTLSELKANNLPPKCISVNGGLKIFCQNVNSLMKHLDEIRILVDERNHISYVLMKQRLTAVLQMTILTLRIMHIIVKIGTALVVVLLFMSKHPLGSKNVLI